jgi:putative flippase GtrA/acetyl esterase/lipase
MNAHACAVVFLASTARVPVVTRCVELLTREPSFAEVDIAGVPAVVVRPHAEPLGTILFLNGGTRLGCGHPAVLRLARGIGRAGYSAVVPELPGLRRGELTPATLDLAIDVASEAAATGPIAIFGVSAGASLALLAAAEPKLAGRVCSVVAIAPWANLDPIVRLATTGDYEGTQLGTNPLVQQFVASSLTAVLAPGNDGDAVADLLANRDPERFDALRAGLPREVEAAVERLSPLRVVHRIDVPIELAAAGDDAYFPLAEVQALAAAAPRARVTFTSVLDHVRLRRGGDVPDLVRFCGFTARSFAAAATREQRAPSPLKRRATQPAKFLAVGACGYVVNLLVFAALYSAGSAYAAASAAAYLVANALMYVGNRYFTFRLSHAGFWSAYGRYLAVGVLVAGCVVVLLGTFVEAVGMDVRLGQALALLAISPVAFLLFKRWTFRIRSA